jgi:hypothetical protein
MLGGLHTQSGRVQKISPSPVFDSLPIQAVEKSLYQLSYPGPRIIIKLVAIALFSKLFTSSLIRPALQEHSSS